MGLIEFSLGAIVFALVQVDAASGSISPDALGIEVDAFIVIRHGALIVALLLESVAAVYVGACKLWGEPQRLRRNL